MKTNFFQQIAGLGFKGNFLLNINQDETGVLTVSAVLKKGNTTATAGNQLPPMLFKGTPEELDEGFFEQFAQPVKQTLKLFTNLEAYQAELDKAKKQPEKAGKTTTANPKKPADNSLFAQPAEPEEPQDDEVDDIDETETLLEKQRLFDEAMQRVAELNTQMKYKEAIAQLPDADEYPDKADELKTKRAQLEKRQELFASLQTEV